MHFNHRPYQKGETIAAIATAPGEGAVAIVRISGDKAIEVAQKVYSGRLDQYASHTLHFGKIIENDAVVDEVLVAVMRAPRSYTGEDTVEIQCHGGSLISRRVLEVVLRAGARAALPGEFTFKAYMNGKLDLAQAEAVQQLIAAKNDLAVSAAGQQLKGVLSSKIEELQKELVDIAAMLEAWVDFPEEGLEFAAIPDVIRALEKTRWKIQHLRDTFQDGKIVHEGLSLCLVGAPNVGKSSLMNALLGKERAIVTDVPGTTRDLLEAEMRLGGLHFKLLDTAGIRETTEVIEREGIRRSMAAMIDADVILFVLDAGRAVSDEEKQLLEQAPQHKTIPIWNKIDVASAPAGALGVSAKTGEGLEALKAAIDQKIWRFGPPSKEEVVITSARHHEALHAAAASIDQLIVGLRSGTSPEFLASDMRAALFELGTIIGMDITEDILSAIFSKFCVGK
ncbi:MAG: tRNA uridine-5-carboxymethylaminomethyl(34) synthesis GTPase MnmE [Verrucomicrobia bacterium]|nr:tRNA uridine-5-carboxymethylaminomethyl(34) synthesis GTPase MnmE [Verrucomicrobiota bacterium]